MNFKPLVFVALIVMAIFSSCGVTDSSDKDIAYNKSKEILQCLDDRDRDGLKSLFCQNVLNTVELDEQIDLVLQIYNGNSTEYSVRIGNSSSNVDDGKVTERYISAYILVTTDTNDEYEIYYACYPIIKNNDWQGIYRISITTETDNEYMIGKHIKASDLT